MEQTRKILIGNENFVFSHELLEESISKNISENLQQKNLKLPDDKRMEILASIGRSRGMQAVRMGMILKVQNRQG